MANVQYIGARYVPKFYENPDDGSNNWKSNVSYEALMIVTDIDDNSYTSKISVPATIGNPKDNPIYWVCTTKYSAAITALQNTVGIIDTLLGHDALETTAQTVTAAINELAKLEFVKTPQMFGAAADGVTDDTTAINNALSGGGIVVFPAGTYLVNGEYDRADEATMSDIVGILVPDNTTMLLDPNAIIKQKPTAKECYRIFNFVDCSNSKLIGGIVVGERDEHLGSITPSEWGHCVRLNENSKNCTIEGVTIKDAWGDGLNVYGDNHIIKGCFVEKNRRNGVTIGNVVNCQVLGNIIVDSGIDTVDSSGTMPKAGIDIEPISGDCYNVIINDNEIIDNVGHGIQIYNDNGTFDGFIINGNIIKGATSDNTIAITKAVNVDFSDNIIESSNKILIANSARVSVSNNKLTISGSVAIQNYISDHVSVTDNSIKMIDSISTDVIRSTESSYVNVSRNDIDCNSLSGTQVITFTRSGSSTTPVEDITVEANKIKSFSGTSIISFLTTNHFAVMRNTVIDSSITNFIKNDSSLRASYGLVKNNIIASNCSLLSDMANAVNVIADENIINNLLAYDGDISGNITVSGSQIVEAKILNNKHVHLLLYLSGGETLGSDTQIASIDKFSPHMVILGTVRYNSLSDISKVNTAYINNSGKVLLTGTGSLAGGLYLGFEYDLTPYTGYLA